MARLINDVNARVSHYVTNGFTFTEGEEYAIVIAATENGSAVANAEMAKAGATVEITATPAENYRVNSVTVMAGETRVETAESEGKYTFVMPASEVEVTVAFTTK